MMLVLSKVKVSKVLEGVHARTSGAHFGVNKTLSKIRDRFYWVRYRDDVESWCRKCTTCAVSQGPIPGRGGK